MVTKSTDLCKCGHPYHKHINGIVCIQEMGTAKKGAGPDYCACGYFKKDIKYSLETTMPYDPKPNIKNDLNALCKKCGHRRGAHAAHKNSPVTKHCYGNDKDGIPYGQQGHKYEDNCSCDGFTKMSEVLDVDTTVVSVTVAASPSTGVCSCGHTYEQHTIKGKPSQAGCLVLANDGKDVFCPCKLFEVQAPTEAKKETSKPTNKDTYHIPLPLLTDYESNPTWSAKATLPTISPAQWEQLTELTKNSEKSTGIYDNYLKKSDFDDAMWSTSNSFSVYLPPKEELGYSEIAKAHGYMKAVTKLTSMVVNGIQLEYLMAGYAWAKEKQLEASIEKRIQERVEQRLQEELKKKHKGDCIPTFRKRDRKFRNG